MILLVGEQPAPNLLPLRHYDPSRVMLVHTDLTQKRAERLAAVIGTSVVQPLCKTGAFRIDEIEAALQKYLQEHGLASDELIFNLTGGTKTMALAAYEMARQRGARAFYYQTEDNQSIIHPFRFEQGHLIADEPVPILQTLTLDDYLKLYVGSYTLSQLPKDPFEAMVYEALQDSGFPDFEIMPAAFLTGLSGHVEVDMLVRLGNQVAALEVKQSPSKKAIDQLNGVTDQRTLGTYTRKILVSATPLDENNSELAVAYRIQVVVLESGKSGQLSPADSDKLVHAVRRALEPRR